MTLQQVLEEKIPTAAVDYCVQLWEETPFHFKVSRTRSTCLGNYKFYRNQHYISVNHDLNPYNFLITYIHEVAHLRVQHLFKGRRKTLPHGEEWKNTFKQLLKPIQQSTVFPEEVLLPLNRHMINPKASSTTDPALLTALKKYNTTSSFTLAQVANDGQFIFKKRAYKRLSKRRTRALVECLISKKRYTLSLLAEVTPLPFDK